MSKNRNRAKLNNAQNNEQYGKILLNEIYPMYWDEGCNFYPKYRRGYKNTNKQLLPYQIRMYKTWKHNRKKQWKKEN